MKRNLMLAVLLFSALLLAACGGGPSAEDIPDTVEYTIEMYDGEEFKFEPETLELWVGQEVTLHFVNMGEKDHEFMVGQDVNFDPGYPNAFHTDFFENIEPVVVQGMAMRDDQMIMADMGDDMDMEEEGDMDMEDDHEDSEDDHAEEEGMDDMEMEEDDHSEDEAAHDDDHHGYMVMATQDQPEATITFTVTEDMVGEWEFGCFEDDGQHYDDGMKGTLVIHEAPSS